MGKTIKRDILRGAVSYFQNKLGIKKYNASKIMSIEQCYNAIYDVVKSDIINSKKKDDELFKKTNIALNELNCELKKEMQNKEIEAKNKIEYLEKQNNRLRRSNFDVLNECEELRHALEKSETLVKVTSVTCVMLSIVVMLLVFFNY